MVIFVFTNASLILAQEYDWQNNHIGIGDGIMLTKKFKPIPTQAELKRLFTYKDGNFIRKVSTSHNAQEGDVAGGIMSIGYHRVTIKKARYLLHRLIWIYVHGSIDPKLEIDHINGVRNDNRIENLRLVSRQQNHFNETKAKGYSWNPERKKWNAHIGKNYKKIYLGLYDTEEEARKAYLEAKRKYHKI